MISPLDYLPLFVRVAQRDCLIVGGGAVALRKARLLQRAGARLRVVAPAVHAELDVLAQVSGGTVRLRKFVAEDVHATDALVIAATPHSEVQQAVVEAARAAGVWVNAVDSAVLSDAIFPSLVDRDPLLIALSSSGRAPVLLRQWRERLEALLPTRLGSLVSFAGSMREAVAARVTDPTLRRRLWERVFSGSVAARVLDGDEIGARDLLEQELDGATAIAAGEVYIVGAGPGAPDLLTLRALQLMQRCDVVLYDQLVPDAILDLVRRDADRVSVGKRGGGESVEQARIHTLMIDLARSGKRVLRLKGGDPFVFGRGGEEVAELIAASVPFQVVPGITAAVGCAAYAGIPLTHRDAAQSVCFATGHRQINRPPIEWSQFTRPGQTLVIYMAGRRLGDIVAELLNSGRDAATPIALVLRGTLPTQKVIVGTLADIVARWSPAHETGPMITIIGEVVAYRGLPISDDASQSQETTRSWLAANATKSS